ncbi:heavy metal translocating P-type ATPase [Anoxybacillus ayderensis]|uniref:heavy metal translocating P-type ATPase n=1 Tax=Anoxybacillus ayderensis TaxID=265546 RepID=UPI000A2690CA|nr:cation-translocating P-type ATPase [Anoxybacillus ayderensis]MED0658018.1 cation-translocating P-type ATPase [Anoxybacillus ayderensis]OSX54854.1 heavy metal translocating P-type ATPase [Anoxybacillus ayderensis]
MKEYQVKGLTCANCARALEEQIQSLPYGEGATLSYNSGKLRVNERVNLEKVRAILATDGAYMVEDEQSQRKRNPLLYLVGTSIFLFVMAFLLERFIGNEVVIIYIIATALSGYKTFIKGLKNIVRFRFNMDTLMTIALIGAFGIGEWKEATVVAILFGINEYLEGLGMERARRSLDMLLKQVPKEAIVICNGQTHVVSIDSLQVGDVVLVRPGEKIPSDGVVIQGKSSVNEAAITGESMPIEKETGMSVYGGSVNNEGMLHVQITKQYKDSSLSKILHLVQEAQETKTPLELFIQRFAKYYTPFIMVVALFVMTIPPLSFGVPWHDALYQGLAVLIVGCPCALILSSPIALLAGMARNARKGVLVKGGVHLETLGRVRTIAFDKTGTITKGKPHVTDVIAYIDENELLRIAASLESASSHPLAQAIVQKAKQHDISYKQPEQMETRTGSGIEGKIDGKRYRIGNERMFDQQDLSEQIQKDAEKLKSEGKTIVFLADEQHVLGLFGIADEVREESKEVMKQLHRIGIRRTVMLTGDHEKTAQQVAKQVGVTDVFAQLVPEQKVEKIKQLMKDDIVAMVGDGMNDAPALAHAHVGIAMGKGTDSAIETADVVLMQDHLGKLPEAIAIARRVNRTIRLNIAVALGLKAMALLLTIPGWLTLWIAILSDMGATIFVSVLSLLILWEKRTR